jgi:hypothetical protein
LYQKVTVVVVASSRPVNGFPAFCRGRGCVAGSDRDAVVGCFLGCITAANHKVKQSLRLVQPKINPVLSNMVLHIYFNM